ncbi:MAG: cytochrome d ubiquinol oxidase subunit II, partial [Muribaculaceae bacterium]|nr:cytochrome d ubiquinol oxidase subunit II [Muribaculaceae bacterium]
MEALQIYWWALISLLGALLVFLLFVQGGQTMLCMAPNDTTRNLMVNTLGRKWELTFTTLVVFGGAFFASFPLFYSTSFGGAYWLWMLILLRFVLQAFSYEFRRKQGNILGRRVYDIFLFINGAVGCILLGVAVGTLFFGADFTVTKANLTSISNPVISTWGPSHGLEA